MMPNPRSARYHVAGITASGPTGVAVPVTSAADYHLVFGDRTPASAVLYDDVATFLAEGGREVFVTKVPGDNPAPDAYVDALDATAETTRGGCVSVPGQPLSLVGPRLIDHADRFGKLALLFGRQDDSAETLAAQASTLGSRPGADATGVFWPWVTTVDPTTQARTHRSPGGYVAAVRARGHYERGYWDNPDGPASTARRIHTLRFHNTPRDNERLSEMGLSPLVSTREGVALHGWWSLAGDRANFSYLDTRDLLNNLAVELSDAYETVTSHTWDTMAKNVGQINALTKGVLATAAKGGAFNAKAGPNGSAGDPGYIYTVTTPAEQPPDRNVVIVRVAVRPRTHAVLVGVRTFRVPLTTPLEVTR